MGSFIRKYRFGERVISKIHGVCDIDEVIRVPFVGFPYRIKKLKTGELFWSEEHDLIPYGDKVVILNEDNCIARILFYKGKRLVAWDTCELGEYGSFSFPEAASHVLYKLFKGKQETTPYNGAVICVKQKYHGFSGSDHFTVGKIYSVVDGIVYGDSGFRSKVSYNSIHDMCSGLGTTFIPFRGGV